MANNLCVVCKQYQSFFQSDLVWSRIWNEKYKYFNTNVTHDFRICYKQLKINEAENKKTNKKLDVQLAVVGETNVGKSALVVKFIQDLFVEVYDPTIEDHYYRLFQVSGVQVLMTCLDTTCKAPSLVTRPEMKNQDCFLICYDCTDRASFLKVTEFNEQINLCGDKTKVIVECKSDLRNPTLVGCVTENEGRQLAKSLGCPFISTSSKCAINTERTFALAAEIIYALKFKIFDNLQAQASIIRDNNVSKKKCTVS
ncbi:hypothetical protein AKO1_007512 [Acrasis kona]|uniref:Uncharacterized protein n=1 Tax=Acrasis kona TaxID=1008807 RepID=A0AAW2YQV2_9EUKA